MSVILEFSVANDEFAFGRTLSDLPGSRVELEKVVPTDASVVPFLWVSCDDYVDFERRVEESEQVLDLTQLDRLDDVALYRLDWREEPHDLLLGLAQTDGTILEAYGGGDGWEFRIRFRNHDGVSQFYNFCMEHDITIHIDRSYTLSERTEFGHRFGLSQEQREALVLGLEQGYFDTPARAGLSDVAEELGISPQATSNRIRRGVKSVLDDVLLGE